MTIYYDGDEDYAYPLADEHSRGPGILWKHEPVRPSIATRWWWAIALAGLGFGFTLGAAECRQHVGNSILEEPTGLHRP